MGVQTDLRQLKPLEEYAEYLDKLSTRSIPLIEKYSDISMAFACPEGNVRGQDAAQKLLLGRFKSFDNLHFQVQDFFWGRRGDLAYIRWNMRFDAKAGLLRRPDKKAIEGIIEIGFSPANKVCSHTEFWSNTALFKSV